MARLFTSGFELNSTTAGVEFDTLGGTGFSIQSGVKRSGNYAGKFLAGSSIYGSANYTLATSAAGRTYRARFYINITTLPTASQGYVAIGDLTSSSSTGIIVTLKTDGKVQVRNASTLAQIGSDGPTLSTGIWYCIEFSLAYTGGACIARVDGTEFVNTTGPASIAINNFGVEGTHTGGTFTAGEWYFDDIAVNDDQGSKQNSWPGAGKVICLRPDSAGDANTFGTQTGGTAGAANNFTRVQEVTPDDATTFNGSNTANQEDLYNCGASGIGASDTVNVVEVGYRYRRSASGIGPTVKLECMKTTGGTKAQSAGFPNSTTWKTNANAAPRTSPLRRYVDPDGGAWTQSTLDTMQIGMLCTETTTPRCDVSTVWAMVEYVPASSTPIIITDSGSGSEGPLIGKNLKCSEQGTGNDGPLSNKGLLIAQAGSAVEAILRGKAIALAENATGVDEALKSVALQIAEAGGGVDQALAGKGLKIADIATGSEVLGLGRNFFLAEIGVGVEAIRAGKGLKIIESGGGVDQVQAGKSFVLADVGLGIDAVVCLAGGFILITDLGSAIDLAKVSKNFGIIDFLAGADAVRVNKDMRVADNLVGNEAVVCESATSSYFDFMTMYRRRKRR